MQKLGESLNKNPLKGILTSFSRKNSRADAIRSSGLFDANWYAEMQNLNGEEEAIHHYISFGSEQSIAPHPLFDIPFYRLQHPEVIGSGLTDLEHYILRGRSMGATPTPLFDRAWYKEQVKSSLPYGTDEFRHFLQEGALRGLSPHPIFDKTYYLQQNPELANKPVNLLTHFAACGAAAGKSLNRLFDNAWYTSQYGDQIPKNTNGLAHFIAFGAEQGLSPHPLIDLDLFCAQDDSLPSQRIAAYICLVQGKGSEAARRMALERLNAGKRPLDGSRAAFKPDADAFVALEDDKPVIAPGDLLPEIPAMVSPNPILSPLPETKLVTVDIWDTVIRRDCHPDEIKLQSARHLYLSAYHDLRPVYRDIQVLFQARITAENASANNDDFEYRYEDAVDLLLQTVLVSGVSETKIKRYREKLIQHELLAEKRTTRLDPTMKEYLRNLKTPAMFVSDFYTSARFLSDLLDSHHARGWFQHGYASSDTFETKRSGELFDKVLAENAVSPFEVLHIGDNTLADVNVPRKKGIKACHFIVEGEVNRREWFGEAFYALRSGKTDIHNRRITALCESHAQTFIGDDENAQMRRTGARLAPLAFSYVLSIIESAIQEQVDRVHYFTREGLFFRKVHDAIAAQDPFNIPCPSSEILHVSRRATFAASLKGTTPDELMRLWNQYSTQSIEGLATSLNLDVEAVCALAQKADLDPHTPVEYPWLDKAFTDFLASRAFQDLAQPSLTRQRENLTAYLKDKGVFGAKRLIISDIGWRGTIQDNLAELLPDCFIFGHYLGVHTFLNRQRPNVGKSGWIFDWPRGLHARVSDLAPIEMIFNGPSGSVIGYEPGADGCVPITEIIPGEESVVAGPVAALQEGLLSVIPAITDYVRRHGLTAANLRELAINLGTQLTRQPPKALANVFQRLQHNETFGIGHVDDISAKADFTSEVQGLTSSELHAAALRALGHQRWQEGAIRSGEIADWWANATPGQRACIPTAISKVHAPGIIKARGSKLIVYAPAPIRASGGHRTIFNMVRRLASIGLEPEIFLESPGAGVEAVEEYLGETRAIIHTQWHSFIPSQIAFATIAHSAQFVAGLDNTHHGCYLVQDFEAMFNPMSDGYIRGENSFAQGLQHFTIGNWLTDVITKQFGGAALPAGLGADTQVYRPLVDLGRMQGEKSKARKTAALTAAPNEAPLQSQEGREAAICFLYQPDKPRRLPELGIQALSLVKVARPDCKIYLYGSNIPLHLDFEVENLGLINDLNELNALYNRCTAGLCISASNPSRIPYEMMAAGCVPVDLYRYNNLLDHKSGTIQLCYQDAQSLAQGMLELLDDADKAQRMSMAGRKFVSGRTLDWEMDVIANHVLAMLNGDLTEKAEIDLLYDEKPIIAKSALNSEKNLNNIEFFCKNQFSMAK